MLARRLRRRANIKTTLGYYAMKQTAVTASFRRKQLLLFTFAEQGSLKKRGIAVDCQKKDCKKWGITEDSKPQKKGRRAFSFLVENRQNASGI